MSKFDFDAIPAAACTMNGGEFQLESNGEKSKTRKIRIKARSGQPIEHWFWGRIVHDLSGMRKHKDRLPIDYAHNDSEVLGYLNHFDSSTGDLVASGALTPFKDDDRASEVIAKMDMGVPYEASIFFGGDGIVLQDVPEGTVEHVNGRRFDGPGVIVREWPLRGVAVCPYGADANTESKSFKSAKNFRASAWKPEPKETETKENKMSEEVKPAPVAVEAEKLPVELTKQEAAPEVKAVEAPVVEQPVVEAKAEEKKPEEAKSVEQPVVEASGIQKDREEFKRMAQEFGAEVAAEVFSQGGDYAAAQKLAYDRMKKENESLKKQLAAIPGGKPAEFAPEAKKGGSLFKTGK